MFVPLLMSTYAYRRERVVLANGFLDGGSILDGLGEYILPSTRPLRGEMGAAARIPLLQIQGELNRQQTAVLARCAELQRRLDDHRRILKYLGRRLS